MPPGCCSGTTCTEGAEWYRYDYEQALSQLTDMLLVLEGQGCLYDMVSYGQRGGHRDDAPPSVFGHIAREWSSMWAYPKLITATNASLLERCESEYGDCLITVRGEVPGTD